MEKKHSVHALSITVYSRQRLKGLGLIPADIRPEAGYTNTHTECTHTECTHTQGTYMSLGWREQTGKLQPELNPGPSRCGGIGIINAAPRRPKEICQYNFIYLYIYVNKWTIVFLKVSTEKTRCLDRKVRESQFKVVLLLSMSNHKSQSCLFHLFWIQNILKNWSWHTRWTFINLSDFISSIHSDKEPQKHVLG